MVENRSDFDNPWKEAISLYFRPFMKFFFPQIEGEIDWERGYEFLDQEFQQVVREAETGKAYTDKLVKVWLANGTEIWVLVHIEVQSQAQEEFPERIYVYNYRIYDRYRKPVVSLAILADERETWRPTRYREELWGWYVEMGFPTVKLLDYRERMAELEESNNPFAVIVAAHLTTQETRRDTTGRYEGKLRIAKSLYRRGYGRQDILELFRLIDWMVNLPEAAEEEFQREIQHFEEENQMPYVTSVERLARQEGLSQGIAEGISQGIAEGIIQNGREVILDVLEVRFQEVPTEVIQKINEIEDPTLLKTILREAIALGSVEQFRGYLQEIGF
jgi:hypothetical protein